ncbi:MAG: hypothetical protein QXU40_01215 [Candidatus Pacearchaeota archaeon]
MGLFGKSKKEGEKKDIPSFPELPSLPELPELEEETPKFPELSYGPSASKFSKNIIKEAITGEEEGEIFSEKDDERVLSNLPQTQKLVTKDFGEEDLEISRKGKTSIEPIFIRIDKFEEAIRIFDDVKKRLNEIEKEIEEIKKIREKEENEIESWIAEIKTMKENIEKIDKDIFSRL